MHRADKLRNRYSDLLHRVAMSNRDGIIRLYSLEIYSDAKRSSDFVLPSIPSAYALRLVILSTETGT